MSKNKKKLIKLIISSVIFIILKVLFKLIEVKNYIELICYLSLYIFLAYKVVKSAVVRLFRGNLLDENFLMVLASSAAFIIGDYSEGVIVMLLYQIGELFENFAVRKTRNSISDLMNIKPDIANVFDGKDIVELDPSLVNIGDTIVVKVGERIPLDGIVIKGTTYLDTSMLTGESLPKEVAENDIVLSGAINTGSIIYVKVTKTFEDSTVTKILDLVENASNKKTKTENFITRFSRIYTPTVVILALLIFIIPTIIDSINWYKWLKSAISFLVVSCPCALVISVPLSFFSGIGSMSKKGILVKGSNYLELLGKANIFVFDKTGTLTKGCFEVKKVDYETSLDELYEISYICEKNSNHPFAKSITKYIEKHYDKINKIDTFNYTIEEIPGLGIKAINNDSIYLVGSGKLLDKYGVEYKASNDIGSIIYVAKDNIYKGSFLIKDQLKPDTKQTIDYLNANNYKTIMLTGDNQNIAEEIYNKLSLSSYEAQLLPSDKVSKLEEIMKNKSKHDVVAYVGDGINDAPVLMMADVGISMGQIGSDSAIEASDVVIMHDDLSSIIKAKKVSKKTLKIAIENIIFAITIKVAILILSIFSNYNVVLGTYIIWLAVFADVGVSVIAILNSMRALK